MAAKRLADAFGKQRMIVGDEYFNQSGPQVDGNCSPSAGAGDVQGRSDSFRPFFHSYQTVVAVGNPVPTKALSPVMHRDGSLIEIDGSVNGDGFGSRMPDGVADRFGDDGDDIRCYRRTGWSALGQPDVDHRVIFRHRGAEVLHHLGDAGLLGHAQVGNGAANVLNHAADRGSEFAEVFGQIGVGGMLQQGQIECQTERRQRGADLVVKIARQSSPFFADGPAGNVLKQQDVGEGQGNGLEGLDGCLVFGAGGFVGGDQHDHSDVPGSHRQGNDGTMVVRLFGSTSGHHDRTVVSGQGYHGCVKATRPPPGSPVLHGRRSPG